MKATRKNISRLYGVINNNVFTVCGELDYDRVTDAVIVLANTIYEYEGDYDAIWYIGEFGDCCLSDFIVGAYWHYTEWHAGQWSNGYAALSALGQVFSPGMSSAETDNPAFEMLSNMAAKDITAVSP